MCGITASSRIQNWAKLQTNREPQLLDIFNDIQQHSLLYTISKYTDISLLKEEEVDQLLQETEIFAAQVRQSLKLFEY
jgi:hypothetical protein